MKRCVTSPPDVAKSHLLPLKRTFPGWAWLLLSFSGVLFTRTFIRSSDSQTYPPCLFNYQPSLFLIVWRRRQRCANNPTGPNLTSVLVELSYRETDRFFTRMPELEFLRCCKTGLMSCEQPLLPRSISSPVVLNGRIISYKIAHAVQQLPRRGILFIYFFIYVQIKCNLQ